MKKNLLRLFLAFTVLLTVQAASAVDSREYIRNYISQWGECHNVAITRTNGDVAIYGRNGGAWANVPKKLDQALTELHDDDEAIKDVQLTEDGNWLVLYGDNGCRWSGIPYDLERKLREFNSDQEEITSVTFNDNGEWIVITTNYISASHQNIQDWLAEGLDMYGQLWAACITDDGLVAVFESGYRFFGNVPEELQQALRETSIDVYRIKIAGNSWFFADKYGSYKYRM